MRLRATQSLPLDPTSFDRGEARSGSDPSKVESHKPDRLPNGGWGWTIVLASFTISFITDGFLYNTGTFYDRFLVVYGEGETQTTLFYAVMTGMVSFIGPLASSISILYGCRLATILGACVTIVGMMLSPVLDHSMLCHTLTLGFITGTGLGLMFLPQITIINQWFDHRLATATGISVCGSGFGTAAFGFIIRKLVDEFDWKTALVILAGIQSINILCALTFKMPPSQISSSKFDLKYIENGINVEKLPTTASVDLNGNDGLKSNNQKKKKPQMIKLLVKMFNKKLLNNVVFDYFLFANFIGSLVYFIPIVVVSDRIGEMEIGDSDDKAMLMVYFGIVNGISRTMAGYLTDFKGVNRTFVYGLSILGMGVSMACSNMVTTIDLMKICYCFFGVAEGFHSCLNSVVLDDMFGTENVSSSFGIILFFDGLAAVFGPLMISWISTACQRKEKDYVFQIWLSTAFFIFAGTLLVLTPLVERLVKRHDSKNMKKKTISTTNLNSLINPVFHVPINEANHVEARATDPKRPLAFSFSLPPEPTLDDFEANCDNCSPNAPQSNVIQCTRF